MRAACTDDYGCYGHLVPELNTEVGRAAILKLLRAERNGKGVNRKQTTELVKEFNAGVKKLKAVKATYSTYHEDGRAIDDENEFWEDVTGLSPEEAAKKVLLAVLDNDKRFGDSYLSDAKIPRKPEFPTIETNDDDDNIPVGQKRYTYSFCGEKYDAEISVDIYCEE